MFYKTRPIFAPMETLNTRMNVCNQGEADFFLSHIKPEHRVLEFGSGGSTLDIAALAARVVSVEHNKEWYDKISAQIPENATLLFHPPTSEPTGGDDGTAEQFHDYIHAPLKYVEQEGPFDIIFIDGRARVACAEICEKLGHAGTLVFIHDYNHPNPQYTRTEYYDAEKYLTKLNGHFTMWKFLITALVPPPVPAPIPTQSEEKKESEPETSHSEPETSHSEPGTSHSEPETSHSEPDHKATEPIKKKTSSKGSSDDKAQAKEKSSKSAPSSKKTGSKK